MMEEKTIIGAKELTYKKLGDVCRITYGKGLPTKDLKSEGYPVFGANGIIGFNDKYLYEQPEVLISCRGAYSGKINFSPPKCFVTNNSLILEIKDHTQLDKKFLFHILHSVNKSKLVTGTAQPQVTINNAVDLAFPIPPLETQQQIVSKIEELFSELDKGIEELKTAQQQLKVYRQAVLKWAFEGKLTNENVKEGELPEGWKRVQPAEIASSEKYSIGIGPFGSNLKTSDYTSEGVPLIFVKNITRNDFYLDRRFVSISKSKELLPHFVLGGDILITKMGDPPGDCAVYPQHAEPAILTADCLKFRIDPKKAIRTYVYYLMQCEFIKRQIGAITMGVAQKKISVDRFKSLILLLPRIEEQNKIVQEIESRLSVCDKIEETISKGLKQAEALRQSILKQVLEGKL